MSYELPEPDLLAEDVAWSAICLLMLCLRVLAEAASQRIRTLFIES